MDHGAQNINIKTVIGSSSDKETYIDGNMLYEESDMEDTDARVNSSNRKVNDGSIIINNKHDSNGEIRDSTQNNRPATVTPSKMKKKSEEVIELEVIRKAFEEAMDKLKGMTEKSYKTNKSK